jgi:hypothetical protein
MVDLADPVIEQVVELLQAGDRVPGRVVAGGDFDQELVLDGLEYLFDLAPAGWLTGQSKIILWITVLAGAC